MTIVTHTLICGNSFPWCGLSRYSKLIYIKYPSRQFAPHKYFLLIRLTAFSCKWYCQLNWSWDVFNSEMLHKLFSYIIWTSFGINKYVRWLFSKNSIPSKALGQEIQGLPVFCEILLHDARKRKKKGENETLGYAGGHFSSETRFNCTSPGRTTLVDVCAIPMLVSEKNKETI